jgi:hypothetical protein
MVGVSSSAKIDTTHPPAPPHAHASVCFLCHAFCTHPQQVYFLALPHKPGQKLKKTPAQPHKQKAAPISRARSCHKTHTPSYLT